MSTAETASVIRTYFWADRIHSPFGFWWRRRLLNRAWLDFRTGNAGDIFAHPLLGHFYPGSTVENTRQGPRLLCIGSISNVLQAGDVLAGIGSKSPEVLPSTEAPDVYIHGLRGPLTLKAYETAGYDVSNVQFLADPGMMIAALLPDQPATPNKVIFIPHYRERKEIRSRIPAGIEYVDIDDDPLDIGRQIQTAECVYSSSLHGIIFAHALGRPCVLVAPQTVEPYFKYEDHYLAMGLAAPTMLEDISKAPQTQAPTSPADVTVKPSDITFPPAELLKDKGVMR